MAVSELARNKETRYCVFFVDGKGDLENLPTSKQNGKGDLSLSSPCCVGSVARCADGKKYILNGSDAWTEYKGSDVGGTGGGGGIGGGGVDDADIATDEDVQNMIEDVF